MRIFGKKKLTEKEQLYIEIIQKMIQREDSIIEINPDCMSYLISLEAEKYYINIDSEGIKISNHDFLILRRFEANVLDAAKEIVKIEATLRREKKIQSIFDNEDNLLIKIKNSL